MAFSSATAGLVFTCPSCRLKSKTNLILRQFKGRRCQVWQLNSFDGNYSHLQRKPPLVRHIYPKKKLLLLATADGRAQFEEDGIAISNVEKLSFLSEEDVHMLLSNEERAIERSEGKPGFVSFYAAKYRKATETIPAVSQKESSNLGWFIGPAVLVASLVLPSLYLRKILSLIFEDSLLTDFLILFFTEGLFYCGVAIFLFLIDRIQRPLFSLTSKSTQYMNSGVGVRISSVVTLVLSLIIPLVTMGVVWPWTGPAASATLAPYLVGIVVQFAFEKFARHQKSPSWFVIPVIFQVYRLHQLNRAAQLVTALSFSVKGAETTPQTLAINSSLGTLFHVLQFLGVICIWSLSSFLMRLFPSSAVAPDP